MRNTVPPSPTTTRARTTVRQVLALQLFANGLGALIVIVYLLVLYPVEQEGERVLGVNGAVFGIYLTLTLVISIPLNRLGLRRALRWALDDRTPTAAERNETLRQPLRQTVPALVGWFGAAVVFSLVNDDPARIAVGIALAGMLTCTLLYQLLERTFRPLFALALSDVELLGQRREVLPRIMLAWWIGSALPLVLIGLAPATLPADEVPGFVDRVSILVVLCLVAGGFVMRGAASSVSVPVNEVRDAMARVEAGDTDISLPVDHVGELGRLQAGFNAMVAGLRERHRVEDLFGRLVGPDVARQALQRDPELGGEEREITALFVDRSGFTSFAETHTPTEIVADLNLLFGVVIDVVEREGGWVNKFEGDAALCLFGAPGRQPDHAARALRAAAALPAAVATLPAAPQVGIGVASGHVLAGHIGSTERYEYTVIGDAVNVASRLCGLAKERDGRVLAGTRTIELATGTDGPVPWRLVGELQLRGRAAPLEVFEPTIEREAVAQSSSTVTGRPSGPQS